MGLEKRRDKLFSGLYHRHMDVEIERQSYSHSLSYSIFRRDKSKYVLFGGLELFIHFRQAPSIPVFLGLSSSSLGTSIVRRKERPFLHPSPFSFPALNAPICSFIAGKNLLLSSSTWEMGGWVPGENGKLELPGGPLQNGGGGDLPNFLGSLSSLPPLWGNPNCGGAVSETGGKM